MVIIVAFQIRQLESRIRVLVIQSIAEILGSIIKATPLRQCLTETIYLSIKSCCGLGKTGRDIDEVVSEDPSTTGLNRLDLSLESAIAVEILTKPTYFMGDICIPTRFPLVDFHTRLT